MFILKSLKDPIRRGSEANFREVQDVPLVLAIEREGVYSTSDMSEKDIPPSSCTHLCLKMTLFAKVERATFDFYYVYLLVICHHVQQCQHGPLRDLNFS